MSERSIPTLEDLKREWDEFAAAARDEVRRIHRRLDALEASGGSGERQANGISVREYREMEQRAEAAERERDEANAEASLHCAEKLAARAEVERGRDALREIALLGHPYAAVEIARKYLEAK